MTYWTNYQLDLQGSYFHVLLYMNYSNSIQKQTGTILHYESLTDLNVIASQFQMKVSN